MDNHIRQAEVLKKQFDELNRHFSHFMAAGKEKVDGKDERGLKRKASSQGC